MGVYHQAVVSAVSAGVSGAQAWIPCDIHSPLRPIHCYVEVLGAMGSDYTIEGTLQDVLVATSVARAQVFAHPDASGIAVSRSVMWDQPVRAVRLWVTPAASGSNRTTFTVVQGD